MTRQAMLIGPHTYGYFIEATGYFVCTHGAWESRCEILSKTLCILHGNVEYPYTFIENIPEDYIR